MDRPEHHRPGVDPDPHGKAFDAPSLGDLVRVGGDLLGDGESSPDGPLGVVLVRDRRAEQRQHAVAGQILHRAAETLDGVDDPGDGLAHDQADLFRVEPFGEGCGSNQVGEQRGHDLALFPDRCGRVGLGRGRGWGRGTRSRWLRHGRSILAVRVVENIGRRYPRPEP